MRYRVFLLRRKSIRYSHRLVTLYQVRRGRSAGCVSLRPGDDPTGRSSNGRAATQALPGVQVVGSSPTATGKDHRGQGYTALGANEAGGSGPTPQGEKGKS